MVFTRNVLIFLSLCVVVWSSISDAADTSTPVFRDYEYRPRANVTALVQQAMQRARAAQKPLLVAFGADWCHDSRGLSAHFSQPQVHELLQKQFEVLFVDVGFYEDRRKATHLLGYPGYFATPTVLVVRDPDNPAPDIATLLAFQQADSLSQKQVLNQLQQGMALPHDASPLFYPDNPAGAHARRITQQMTDRLQHGFEKLGPMLQQEVQGKLTNDGALNALWKEVKQFRMALQQDIHQLAFELHDNANPDLKPVNTLFTDYPLQSWEGR